MSDGKVAVLSGIIGELSAYDRRGVNWSPKDGFEAVDRAGLRIQIKTRRKRDDRDKSPRMGKFKLTNGAYQFDVGWYVELDEDFDILEIWEAPKKTILGLQKNTDKGIPVRKFKKNAKPIAIRSAFMSTSIRLGR